MLWGFIASKLSIGYIGHLSHHQIASESISKFAAYYDLTHLATLVPNRTLKKRNKSPVNGYSSDYILVGMTLKYRVLNIIESQVKFSEYLGCWTESDIVFFVGPKPMYYWVQLSVIIYRFPSFLATRPYDLITWFRYHLKIRWFFIDYRLH